MTCELCGGPVEEKRVTYTLFYENHWVIVENVPALVCRQCGEKSFKPETVEHLQQVLWSKQAPVKKVQTPVYDLSQTA